MSTLLPDLRTGIRQAPMLKAALPFMAGLMIGRGLALPWSAAWTLAVIALLGALLPAVLRTHHAQRWWRVPAISMSWCALGMLWWMLRDPFPPAESMTHGGPRPLLVELGETGFRSGRTAQFEAVTLSTPAASPARMLLTIEIDSLRPVLVTGDRLWIDCEPHAIDRVSDPGGFDRRTYAATRGIALEAFVPVEDWRLARHVDQWTDVFASARVRVARWLEQSGLPQRERALANALLLGIRDDLEQDQKMAFARSGTMHVLAVSGMHVALIWAVLSMLFGWFGNKTGPRYARGVIILLALWAYAGLTGAPPSVLRATVMCTLFTIGGMVLRSSGHLNSLFASALVLLIWDPLMLWQLSFQLSFLAVLGIILFYQPLLHLWEPPNRVLYYVWSAATVSVAAQLTTTPLSMFVFKSFPVWFLPANIVVVGMVSLAVYGGVLLLLFFKIPLLGALTTWGMTRLLLFLGWSTAFFAALPGAYPGVRIDLAQCLLLYLFMGCVAAWITWGGRVLRWSAAITLLIVLVYWGWQAHQLDRTLRFTVHDRSDATMASLQIGRELYLITDDTLGSRPWLERRIEAQQRATGADLRMATPWERVRSHLAITGTMALGGGFLATHGLLVRVIEAGDPAVAVPVDVLILMRDGRYEMDEIMRGTHPRHGIVLGPDISGSERFRIRSWCEQHQLACHDVKRQGAFILDTEL